MNPAPSEHTVTFDTDGGSTVEAATVKDGEKVTKPTDPTKEGYVFKGWYNGETAYDFESAVTADITLKAKWEVVTYNITYELNGGKADESNPATYNIETADFEIKNPVSGPEATPNFVGWYSDKELTKAAETTIKKGSTGDLTFYAKWSPKSLYTVTFELVGANGSVTEKVVDGEMLSEEQIQKAKSSIPEDYKFENVYSDKECTKEFDIKTKIEADTTVYVKVKEIVKYTVKFESNGGSTVEAATVKDGEKVTKPADPTKEGYAFIGWYNGETAYDFESAVTADITLKAKWEAKIVYIMSKATQELPTSNQYSQVNLPLSENLENKAITSGDWIIVSGKVSMKDTIGQVYVQWGTSSKKKQQLGSFYKGDNTKTEETVYWVYRVPVVAEGETVSYAQLACQKANNGKVEPVEQGTKITLTDFFIARLPKAVIDELTVKIAEEESAKMEKVMDSNSESIQYSPSVNLTVPIGKIVCLYDRGNVNVPYKSHYINGGYKKDNAFTPIYPDKKAQSISIITDVPEERVCQWFQVGLQKKEKELEPLTITNLEVRVIPDSLF